MTIHPVAIVAAIITLSICVLVTWLAQRALRRWRGPARNDTAQWQAIFGACCVVFGVGAWLLLNALGLLHH